MKSVVPWNTENDGTSRTIKAQYYKNGFVNFFIGGDYGATGVFEYCGEGDSEDGIVGVLQVRSADAIDGRLRDIGNDSLGNIVGKINSSQDGVIVHVNSIVPCLTSGHGNCPKVVVIDDDGVCEHNRKIFE